MGLVRVVGAIEVRSLGENCFKCVALFLELQSNTFYRIAYPDTSTFDVLLGMPNVRKRGFPRDVTQEVLNLWNARTYPHDSGSVPCFLWREELVSARDKSKDFSEPLFDTIISQMVFWEDARKNQKGQVRLIVWGELVDDFK